MAAGTLDCLTLGDVGVARDWGWAEEYVEAMWAMLQQPGAADFVVATGESHTVAGFCTEAFRCAGIEIEWKGEGEGRHAVDRASGRTVITVDPTFMRPSDIRHATGDPTRARTQLGWSARTRFTEVVKRLYDDAALGVRPSALPSALGPRHSAFGPRTP